MTTYAARQLYKGAYFTHTRWLDPSHNQSLRCKVTRIAQGVVYYRPHYGWHDDGSEWLGSPTYFPIEDAPKYVAGPTSPYIKSAADVTKLHETILAAKDV